MGISVSGLGSSIDVNSIVSQLMSVEKQPLSALSKKEGSYQSKLSAYGNVKSALSNLQTSLATLNKSSSFQVLKATPSDATVLTATATSSAKSTGTYSVSVSQLAQAQSLVATGQTSATAAIGSGASTTLTFDFGTTGVGSFTSNGNGVKTVTIDSSNNSLQGIRDAINNAKIGVTASIVNDGSGTPYRLTLSSDTAGASNSMKISVAGDATLNSLLGYDPAGTMNLSQTQAAQNANLTINGVAVSKNTNTITDAIPGVTLNLLKTTASPITVGVAQDSSAVQGSIESFIKSYNDLNTMLRNVTAYNESTKTGAALLGDSTIRTIQNQMRSILNTPLSNTGGSLTMLSQVGISFQKDGSLSLDATQLTKAIGSNPQDIARLFAATGSATDSLVGYSSATSVTTVGSYALNVSQLATRGNLAGSAAANLTVSSGVNDTLGLTVDGTSISVTLSAGTYTASALSAELQSKVNGALTAASSTAGVTVSQTGGILSMTSNRYGSVSSISLTGGTAQSSLFGGGPTSAAGLDVTGTIDGIAANGFGQNLTAASGNAQGLSIDILGGATGNRGTISYSQGFAYTLNKMVDSLLSDTGTITARTEGISKSIKDIGNQRDALTVRLTAIEKRYRAQFSSLDAMLSSMNQTSAYLTQQLSKLSSG
ncbi:MAG: flagellar filament capping protein FliD [Pseudomonadota bacterium]